MWEAVVRSVEMVCPNFEGCSLDYLEGLLLGTAKVEKDIVICEIFFDCLIFDFELVKA